MLCWNLQALDVPHDMASFAFKMQVFHAVKLSSCSWSSLLPTIIASLGPEVKIVSWETWLFELREYHFLIVGNAESPVA
jgi:hypothetical protein